MEHRLVFAVFAKESRVFPKVHVLEMIGHETAVTALGALAEPLEQNVVHESQDAVSGGVI